MTKNEFIAKAKEIHGDKYDYSMLPESFTTKEKLSIICPEHGVFEKDVDHHIGRKQGCPACSNRQRYTTESFVKKLKTLPHCENYTFEKVNYVNTSTKVILTCKEHGDFEISPLHLLAGQGCPKCRYIKSAAGRRRSIDEVITAARAVHGDKYDYSLITEYKNDRISYPIICPIHGVFYQAFNNHIKAKQGCPICGREKCDTDRQMTTEEFIEKATQVHEGFYDYSKTVYTYSKDKVTIICPKHGEFEQIARNHLFGAGCPKCFKEKSKVETELIEYLKEICTYEIVENDRIALDGKEIDAYIPELKIGFEMNGLIWHSEKFSGKNDNVEKTDICEEKGIRLIQIFEDEWNNKKYICKQRIKSILGLENNRVYARECDIREVSKFETESFLNENHLQGYTHAKIRYGLYHNNELVSLMTFGCNRINVGAKSVEGEYELIRFANKNGVVVTGGASKLFKHFVDEYKPNSIISYADRRWFNGKLYETLGFSFAGKTVPSYSYAINKKRVNRFNLRKDILVSKYGCSPDMTEKQFCESKGWYRIYDCGCLKYIWKNEK
jgi:hypothetical protein